MINFDTIDKEELKESISYIISTSILNKDEEFTLDEICNEVKLKLNELSETEVKRYVKEKLYMFIDNGKVIEHGSYFSINQLNF